MPARAPATLFLLAALATPATGAPASQEPSRLEEIVVTAMRREESLQSVPIAVTALSSVELRRLQATDLSRLQYFAPTLVVWPVIANSLTATISMRGLIEPDLLPTNDPAVGTYLDGVYIARMTGGNLELVDMQRVEVLRGPQGTLFGRNTIGGAINLIPNRPEHLRSGEATAGAGNYGSTDLEGFLNIPVGLLDGAVRIAGKHVSHAGYGDAILLDRPLSDEKLDYLRAQFELEPGDGWSVNLSGDLTSVHSASQLMTLVAAFGEANRIPALSGNPADDLSNYAGVTDGRVDANRAGNFSARIWGATATVDHVGRHSFKAITAYRQLDLSSRNADGDGTPYDLFAALRRDQGEWQFSQELQLRGTCSHAGADWIVGLLYFEEAADLDFLNRNLVPLSETDTRVRATTANSSAAAYLELTRAIAPKVHITAGARYNVDWRQLISRNARIQKGIESCSLDDRLLDEPGICKASLPRRSFRYVPWRLGIDYAPRDESLLYATVSRGYRAGGYNMRGGTPVSLLAFDPEYVTSFELGGKSDFRDHRIRANVAVYLANYDDMQLGATLPDPVQGVTFLKQNGGHARIVGGEAEVSGMIGAMRLSGSIGLTEGKFVKLAPSVDGVTLDSDLALPKTTYHVAADLPFRMRLGDLEAHIDYGWLSDDGDSEARARCRCSNAYGLLGAMLAFAPRSGSLRFDLWAHNLTDTHYLAQRVDFTDFINAIPGEPRTYGLKVTYHFSGLAASHD